MKKMLIAVLSVFFVFTLMSCDNGSPAARNNNQNQSNDNEFRFTFGPYPYPYGDGGIIIGFSGDLPSELVIPDYIDGRPVTHIFDEVFRFQNLTSVVIGNNVTHIMRGAFANNQITSVMIPDSVTSIGVDAFITNQLTSVEVPGGATVGGAFDRQVEVIIRQ